MRAKFSHIVAFNRGIIQVVGRARCIVQGGSFAGSSLETSCLFLSSDSFVGTSADRLSRVSG